MQDLGKIFNILIIGYFVFLLLISILFGAKRKLYKSLVRLGTVLVCLPVTYFLCKIIANNALDGIIDSVLTEKFDKAEMSVEAMSEILNLAKALCIPLLFVFVYFITNRIMWIVYAIIGKFVSKKQFKGNKFAGICVSVLTCVISFCAFILPINGYVGLIAGTKPYIQTLSTEEKDLKDTFDDFYELTDQIENAGILKATKKMSNGVFNLLSKVTISGTTGNKYKTNAKKEFYGTLEVFNDVIEVVDTDSVSDQNVATIQNAIDALNYNGENSIYAIKVTFTKMINDAATKWKNGESACGVNLLEEFDNNVEEFATVEPMLDALIEANEDNIADTLKSLLNLVEAENNLYTYISNLNTLSSTDEQFKAVVDYLDEYNISTFKLILEYKAEDLSRLTNRQEAENFITGLEILFDKMCIARDANAYTSNIYVEGYDLGSINIGTFGTIDLPRVNAQTTTELDAVNDSLLHIYDFVINKETYNVSYFTTGDNLQTFCEDVNNLLDEIINTNYFSQGIAEIIAKNISFDVSNEEKQIFDALIDAKKAQQTNITSAQELILNNLKALFN